MIARALRFFLASGVSAVTGQVILFVLFRVADWNAAPANIVAVLIGSLIGFVLSTRYVWTDPSTNRRSQLIIFVLLSLLGLVVSTVLAHELTERWENVFAANVGSTLGFGIVWLFRFLVLDRVVFQHPSNSTN